MKSHNQPHWMMIIGLALGLAQPTATAKGHTQKEAVFDVAHVSVSYHRGHGHYYRHRYHHRHNYHSGKRARHWYGYRYGSYRHHPHIAIRPYGYRYGSYGHPYYYHDKAWYWVTHGMSPATTLTIRSRSARTYQRDNRVSCISKYKNVWYKGSTVRKGKFCAIKVGKRTLHRSRYMIRRI